MRGPLTILTCLALLGAGCGGADSGAREGSADEAGVTTRVDTSEDGTVHLRNSGAPARWRLRLTAEIGQVGGMGEASPAEFGRVSSVALAPDGRILVADADAREIRVFGPDGEFVERWGRPGEGPGEFGSLYSLGWIGDTLAVLDPGAGRIGLFDDGGRWLGQHAYPGGVSGSSSLIRFHPAGEGAVYAFWLEAVDGELQRRFRRYTGSGPAETLPWLDRPGSAPASSVTCPRPDRGISFFEIPFAPSWIQAPAPDGRVAAAWTADYRISFVDPGGDTVRTVSRRFEPAAVTEEAWEEALEDYRAFREEWPGVDCDPEMPGKPEARPPVEDLFFDRSGRLWVEAVRADGPRWDVFDPEGRLVGEMEVPPRVDRVPAYVGGGRVAVVAAGGLDVERVRVYEIEGGG